MQAGDHQLRRHEEQNHGGDAEELLQIDAHAALDEHHAKQQWRQSRPDNVPRKLSSSVEFSETAERIRTVSTPSRSTIRKTNGNRPNARVASGQEADLAFDLALELAACLHHENDHGDDEEGGGQHDPAFENVLIPAGTGKQNGHPDAADKGRDQGGIDGFAQLGPTDFGQIGQGNADDQGGFDPFAQGYDECLLTSMK